MVRDNWQDYAYNALFVLGGSGLVNILGEATKHPLLSGPPGFVFCATNITAGMMIVHEARSLYQSGRLKPLNLAMAALIVVGGSRLVIKLWDDGSKKIQTAGAKAIYQSAFDLAASEKNLIASACVPYTTTASTWLPDSGAACNTMTIVPPRTPEGCFTVNASLLLTSRMVKEEETRRMSFCPGWVSKRPAGYEGASYIPLQSPIHP